MLTVFLSVSARAYVTYFTPGRDALRSLDAYLPFKMTELFPPFQCSLFLCVFFPSFSICPLFLLRALNIFSERNFGMVRHSRRSTFLRFPRGQRRNASEINRRKQKRKILITVCRQFADVRFLSMTRTVPSVKRWSETDPDVSREHDKSAIKLAQFWKSR